MESTFKKNLTMLFATSLLFLALMNACKKKEQIVKNEEVPKAYTAVSTEELCVDTWFPHTQTPAPLEGKESSFANKSTTNAIFHQWSWQKFLWLTKPSYGAEKLPLFLNPEKIIQVSPHMDVITPVKGASVVLSATVQAGNDHGVLQTNPAYTKKGVSETVYYSIHIDPIMKAAAEKFKDAIVNKTLSKNNLASFPVGSLELKVSWVATNAIPQEELGTYFRTTAAFKTTEGTYETKEVALLGMHVVGVVENHPEFIWATFEHDDLAPNYNWKKGQASATTNKLLFAKGVTQGISGIKYIKDTKPVEKYKVFDLFQYGVPRDAVTGAFMETAQNEPLNFNNIDKINTCVKASLQDVWKNYFYNGSIWMDTDGYTKKQQAEILVGLRGAIANGSPLSFARGSLNCANVTMETFTQTFQDNVKSINVGTLANCFSCHNASGFPSIGGSPLYMSHIFDSYVKRAEGKKASEVEMLKAKHEVLEYQRLRLN